MKVLAVFAGLLTLSMANVLIEKRGGCGNNCARAVIASRRGPTFPATASSDCSSYFAAVTAVPQPPLFVPSYATACSALSDYSTACGCIGVTPTPPPCSPNLLTDPNNCGKCGNVCPSGVCQNGACSTPSCAAAVCGSFTQCSETQDCQCYTTPDGTGFCTGNQFCSELADCNANSDCGSGSICAVGSCCGRNVCLPINCNNPQFQVRSALEGGARAVGDWSGHKGQ